MTEGFRRIRASSGGWWVMPWSLRCELERNDVLGDILRWRDDGCGPPVFVRGGFYSRIRTRNVTQRA